MSVAVLIAGLGSIGQRHLRNLRDLGVTDVRLYRTGHATLGNAELEAFRTYHDLGRALADRPDAVVVSNPTALHLPVATAAARAGAHLLLEKPVAHELAGVEELRRAVAASATRVLVGYHLRQHPTLRAIKSWLEDGRIGRIISAHAHWGEYLPEWHPWEDYRASYAARRDLGGGVLLTLSHPIDYLRWLIGEVTAVQAALAHSSTLRLDVEDAALLTLRFAGGALGSVYLDYLQRPAEHTLRIVGEGGTIRWSHSDHVAVLQSAATATQQVVTPPAGFSRDTLFVDEMRHFLECVAGRVTPVCSLEDGVAALRVALAAVRSAREAREVNLAELV